MATTADGIVYPVNTDHTRLWEHFKSLADSVQALWDKRGARVLADTKFPPTETDSTGGTIVTVSVPVVSGRKYLVTANAYCQASAAGVAEVAWIEGIPEYALTQQAMIKADYIGTTGTPFRGSACFLFTAATTTTLSLTVKSSSGSGFLRWFALSSRISVMQLA